VVLPAIYQRLRRLHLVSINFSQVWYHSIGLINQLTLKRKETNQVSSPGRTFVWDAGSRVSPKWESLRPGRSALLTETLHPITGRQLVTNSMNTEVSPRSVFDRCAHVAAGRRVPGEHPVTRPEAAVRHGEQKTRFALSCAAVCCKREEARRDPLLHFSDHRIAGISGSCEHIKCFCSVSLCVARHQ